MDIDIEEDTKQIKYRMIRSKVSLVGQNYAISDAEYQSDSRSTEIGLIWPEKPRLSPPVLYLCQQSYYMYKMVDEMLMIIMSMFNVYCSTVLMSIDFEIK